MNAVTISCREKCFGRFSNVDVDLENHLYELLNIMQWIRWFGHVVRMDENDLKELGLVEVYLIML